LTKIRSSAMGPLKSHPGQSPFFRQVKSHSHWVVFFKISSSISIESNIVLPFHNRHGF
jgi:hypothetical protein